MKNDFKPVVGHSFNLRGDWGGVLDCEVLAVEPNKTLSYTWNFAHDDAAFDLKSVVTFTLTPARTGTHLRMEQSGFRPDQKQAFGGAKFGWQKFFAEPRTRGGRPVVSRGASLALPARARRAALVARADDHWLAVPRLLRACEYAERRSQETRYPGLAHVGRHAGIRLDDPAHHHPQMERPSGHGCDRLAAARPAGLDGACRLLS